MRSGNDRRRLTPTAKRMIFDQRGATAAIFAISLPLLVGMGALAVDVGLWSVQKRHAQGAADQAAYSAAIAGTATTDEAAILEAKAVSASMGLVDGKSGVVVTTNKLATFDGESGDFWEVVVEQPQPMWFAAMFIDAAPTARARAVAGTASGGAACIIGLDPTAGVNSVYMNNNGKVTNEDCGVYSNSGLYMDNNSEIDGTAYVSGSITGMGSGGVANPLTGVAPIADPYADVTVSPPGCTFPNAVSGKNLTLTPNARYCGGVSVDNNGTLTLPPGVYYFDTIFKLGNNVVVSETAPGVTLVFLPSAKLDVNGNSPVFNITAPESGPFAGIAMMGRSLGSHVEFKNSVTMNVEGALYFPNQHLEFKNGALFTETKCAQLVGWRVIYKNNAAMDSDCPGSGIRDIGSGKIQLLG